MDYSALNLSHLAIHRTWFTLGRLGRLSPLSSGPFCRGAGRMTEWWGQPIKKGHCKTEADKQHILPRNFTCYRLSGSNESRDE